MKEASQTDQVVAVFDLVAPGYESAALRFFPFCADTMVRKLQPNEGTKVLDIATGTGLLATAAAQAVGASGRVMGIDLSENMLDQAERNAAKMKLNNIDWHVMDAQKLEFRAGYFDYVFCSFGLFFIPDMYAALKDWLRVTNDTGQLMFSSFAPTAFKPMSEMLFKRLADFGVQTRPQDGPPAWELLADAEYCRQLMHRAGAAEVQVSEKQLGFHLRDADQWWEVVWNSGYRGYLEQLDAPQLTELRRAHLAEVNRLAGADGIWMDVKVLFTQARKSR